ncbi:hypothetical protein ACCS45_04380 [Rhizobium ruizarguesonis]
MSFENLRLLAEVRMRLRPTLSELGVNAKTFQTEEGRPGLCFESADGNTVCPVTILLLEGSSSWEGSSLTRKRVTPVKVGLDGWTFYRDRGKAPTVTLKQDGDLALTQIDHALRASGTVKQYDGKNKVVSNDRLVAFYEGLAETFIDDHFVAAYGREGDVETLTFNEPNASTRWRISFDRSGMNLFRDGTIVGIFSRGNEPAAMRLTLDKVFKIDVLAAELAEIRRR